MILRADFHVELSLFSVLKIASVKVPLALALEMSLTQKRKYGLKSASFVVIMLLHKGLTPIHSQKSLGCIWARVSL